MRAALLGCALAAALALGGAFAAEWWGGLVPCALCLVERWPYRLAIAAGVLGAWLPARWARLAGAAMVAIFLAGAGAGAVHVGVENRWWPSPLPQCQAPDLTGLSIAERLARMPAVPSMSCEDPTYLIPWLPVSMAMANLLLSLGLACVAAWALRR